MGHSKIACCFALAVRPRARNSKRCSRSRRRRTRNRHRRHLRVDPPGRRQWSRHPGRRHCRRQLWSAVGDHAWDRAGIWYLAGSNTCVYSNPPDELGATRHDVQTSNRRFRGDEFLIPRRLTRARSRIRIRVRFTPVERPLFPGYVLPELAWSEIAYHVYCFVMPQRN